VVERCEGMRPDEGSSREPLGGKCSDRFNLGARGQNLSQVKDTTEKARLLLIVFMRAGCLELQVLGVRSRQPSRLILCPLMMMMQHTRKDVDHEVSGQCGGRNQRAAQNKLHLNIRQPSEGLSSSSGRNPQPVTVLPNHTQSRQVLHHRQDDRQRISRGSKSRAQVAQTGMLCLPPIAAQQLRNAFVGIDQSA
jgi:hypothetical protein